MGYAVMEYDPDAVTIWCYCCEKFTPHTVFPGQYDTFYECISCGCVIDDEDEVIYPDDKTGNQTKSLSISN